jgi:tripartite-type tricarboxylate transporter receptor subunit TctC
MSSWRFGSRLVRVLALGMSLCVSALPAARAQGAYPDKPIRVVVAFAAGGYADSVARLIGQRLSEKLGQPVVIENRGGAGGNIGSKAVAGARPDGHTLLVNTTAVAINASLYKNPGYDIGKDLVPVALAVSTPGVFTVHPSNPASTLADLIRNYKGQRLSYATAGVGSSSHLAGDYLLHSLAGLDAVHVPYQGGAPALTAGLANQVDLLSISMPTVLAHIRAGRLKVLAVSSLQPVGALPGVPTVAAAGFPGFEESSWVGFFAPAGTEPATLDKLNDEINQILAEPAVRQRVDGMGAEPRSMSRAQFDDYLKSEVSRWGQIIKTSGVKAD